MENMLSACQAIQKELKIDCSLPALIGREVFLQFGRTGRIGTLEDSFKMSWGTLLGTSATITDLSIHETEKRNGLIVQLNTKGGFTGCYTDTKKHSGFLLSGAPKDSPDRWPVSFTTHLLLIEMKTVSQKGEISKIVPGSSQMLLQCAFPVDDYKEVEATIVVPIAHLTV